MNKTRLLKKFLMPCGLCAAVPAIKAIKESSDPPKDDPPKRKLIKPSELPLYTGDDDQTPKTKESQPPGMLEEQISHVRKSVSGFFGFFTEYKDMINDKVSTGIEHSKMTLEFLRDEDNVLPRIGAIGAGGLTGLILAIRKGKFKKILYTSTGALGMASVIYPKEAEEAAKSTKYYVSIGYNFFMGIKPEDAKELEIPWPELPKVPTNFSEFTDLASSVYNWTVSTVGSLVTKTTAAIANVQEESKKDDDKPKPKD